MKYLITPHPDGKRWNARVVCINVDGTMRIHYDDSNAFKSRSREKALMSGIRFALAQDDCDEIKVIPHG